jgi:3-oxoacyl-(acyl-carrier-protein) synthase
MELTPLRPLAHLDLPLDQLDDVYRDEVDWKEGYRINRDARLVLIGLQRVLDSGALELARLREAGIVLGCEDGAMDSYAAFHDGMLTRRPAPLAYSHALPSIPLASAALRHQLTGETYTLVGSTDLGLRVVSHGRQMLAAGRAEAVIVGCWRISTASAPDAPRHGGRARLRLALLESSSAAAGAGQPRRARSTEQSECLA